MMLNQLIVYTTIFGNYDELIDPKEKYPGCDFICFTDQKSLKSDIWQIQIIENCNLPSNLMNRKYKMLPHLFLTEYEWSMYVDANIAIIGNPLDLALKYLTRYNMVIPKHFARDCVYDEAKECVIVGKAKYKEVVKQMNKYRSEGFPKNFGLSENNIILRKHNDTKIIKLMCEWWNEINIYTNRDQLSLAYVLWKNNEQFHFMEENARNSKAAYFEYNNHKSYKTRTFLQKVKDSFRVRSMTKIIPILSKYRIIKL
jgi:hypothetical protein